MEEKDFNDLYPIKDSDYFRDMSVQNAHIALQQAKVGSTYQSLMEEILKSIKAQSSSLQYIEEDEEAKRKKQLQGLKKMREWFAGVHRIDERLVWFSPQLGNFDSKGICYMLDRVIEQGYWRDQDRGTLNSIREFYMLNKDKGNRVKDYITKPSMSI